jgi:predicted porin
MLLKLIALAIAGLASTGAFAQSNVTLSGLVDGGYYGQSLQTAGLADTKTAFAQNGSATSQFNITVTEDLGKGMKFKFFGETDWAPTTNAGTGLLNSYNYLELSGSWGSVRGGNLNTDGLYAEIAAQPFGTAIGSGISGAFGRLSRAGSNGQVGTAAVAALCGTAGIVAAEGECATGNSGARSVRINNSLQYSTPSFNGFSGSLQWAKKNDQSAADAAAASNTAGFVGVGIKYNNGPINVHYVNEQINNGQQVGSGNATTLLANEKVTHNMLTGNYNFGPATVYAGWTSSKNNGVTGVATTADSRSWNLGLKYMVMANLSLAANVLRVDDKTTTDKDRNLNAVGFDYDLSKRSTVYGRYESGDNDKNGVTGASVGGFTRYQLGLRHSF